MKVSALLIEGMAYGEGLNFFIGAAVLEVRRDWSMGSAEYVMYHPQFEPIPYGSLVPEYVATFTDDSAAPVWVRKEESQ